jgi:acetyltransferase-like isoleucine patch superfamily enzyme
MRWLHAGLLVVLRGRFRTRVCGLWGWQIAPDVHIGFSFVGAQRVVLASESRIGHFNVFKSLDHLSLGCDASILNFNIISGGPYTEWPRSFTAGESARIRSNHYFDAGGGIQIGDGTTIAGRGVQVWTHGKNGTDFDDEMEPGAVSIGNRCYIGAGAIITPKSSVGDGSLVGAGAVVAGDLRPFTGHVLVGVPARSKGLARKGPRHPLATEPGR